jgi:hypothetical protein
MNTLYLITAAIKQSDVPDSIFDERFCITSATELEAAAIALSEQPEQTYIWLKACQPQVCLFALNQVLFVQQLFSAWQDFAAEATGHDTEWSYLIPIACLAQTLHLPSEILIVLLESLTQPELELGLNNTLTFHQPPRQAINQQSRNSTELNVVKQDYTLLKVA